jgi:hypothetical protein
MPLPEQWMNAQKCQQVPRSKIPNGQVPWRRSAGPLCPDFIDNRTPRPAKPICHPEERGISSPQRVPPGDPTPMRLPTFLQSIAKTMRDERSSLQKQRLNAWPAVANRSLHAIARLAMAESPATATPRSGNRSRSRFARRRCRLHSNRPLPRYRPPPPSSTDRRFPPPFR